jgi:hypothetical protein
MTYGGWGADLLLGITGAGGWRPVMEELACMAGGARWSLDEDPCAVEYGRRCAVVRGEAMEVGGVTGVQGRGGRRARGWGAGLVGRLVRRVVFLGEFF